MRFRIPRRPPRPRALTLRRPGAEDSQRRRLLWFLALIALVAGSLLLTRLAHGKAGGTAPAPAAAAAKLQGKWKAVLSVIDGKRYPVKSHLSIVYRFDPKGVLTVVISVRGKARTYLGTWAVKARTLTMKIRGQTEVMPFLIKGKRLVLTKTVMGKNQLLHLERQP